MSAFNYFSGARNLGHLLARGRSPREIINLEIRAIHDLLAPGNHVIRAHWHPRDCWAGVLADHLPRGDTQAFVRVSGEFGSRRGRRHPAL